MISMRIFYTLWSLIWSIFNDEYFVALLIFQFH